MAKKLTLQFIQLAWVFEVIVVILYTMIVLPLMSTERIGLWVSILPSIIAIIGSQGAAAGIGPLVSDYLKTKQYRDKEPVHEYQ